MSERDIDAELVARVQNGDKAAFDLLVLKYQRKVMRLLARMIRNPADVEDVAQEAFIRAYRSLPQFRGDCAFYTWLYRIALNTARNWLAAASHRPGAAQTASIDADETFSAAHTLSDLSTPESMLASREIAEAVSAAMADLPADLRTAIALREIDGMRYEDIATAMNSPIGTVRSRIFRAREAIAARLAPVLDAGGAAGGAAGKPRRW